MKLFRLFSLPMTNHPADSGWNHRISRCGRVSLVSGLTFALLTTGVSGVALSHRPALQGPNSGMTLVAAQDTLLGNYTNGKATIKVTKRVNGSGKDTVVSFIADVTVTDATTLKSAFARNKFGQNITEPVSTMAKNNSGVLAINSDYYGFRDDGIVIRNGVSYRDVPARQGLAILRDGTFKLYDEKKTNAAKLLAEDVWHTLSFGPGLLQDGKIPTGIDKYEIGDFGNVQPGGPGSIQGLQPRTGIGVVSNNHFLLIVVDGRNANNSRGVTMTEFAQLFLDLGATTAFNLDGGGSVSMYFNGGLVNKPVWGERATSDMLYVGK